MGVFKNIFILTFIFSLTMGCKGQNKKITSPKNLEEGIEYFEQTWTKKQLEEFKLKDEGRALADVHFGAALWVRNNWIRSESNKEFKKYFNDLGVLSPDDISSILFTSLYRKLNGKNIELDKQVKSHKKYWNTITLCQEKQKKNALGYYNQFKISDTINIFMPVDTSSKDRNAVIYVCPTADWNFDPSIDLKFRAVIQAKYHISSTTNVFFKLKILKMNFPKTKILMQHVEEGKEIDLNLTGLKIR